MSHSLTLLYFCLSCVVAMCGYCICVQIPCRQCGKLTKETASERHHLCHECNYTRKYGPRTLSSPSPPPSSSPPPPLFARPESCIDTLTPEQRWAIIILDKENYSRHEIANKIPCSVKTVGYWLRRYEQTHSVEKEERSGRTRCTEEEEEEKSIATAEEKLFITPKQIKNELSLPCSSRTIRRRLDEVDLHGRVAVSEFPFDDRHIQPRLSFANGYGNWSLDDWDHVIFSDEASIELGPHGQVWVQRPEGEGLNPHYLSTHIPHPPKVSLWGCFCGRGIGQAELYADTLDGAKYKDILAHNLLATADHFYPKEHWWFQHDNAPAHTAGVTRAWLHNAGVDCIDFPPHSPDLNPSENLWGH